MFADRSISLFEVTVLILLWGVGVATTVSITDLYQTDLVKAQALFLLSNIGLSILLLLALLWYYGTPRHCLLPGALWGMIAWNSFHFSQFNEWGIIFIPLEIWVAAKFINVRTGLDFRKGFYAAAITRLVVMITLYFLKMPLVEWIRSTA